MGLLQKLWQNLQVIQRYYICQLWCRQDSDADILKQNLIYQKGTQGAAEPEYNMIDYDKKLDYGCEKDCEHEPLTRQMNDGGINEGEDFAKCKANLGTKY